MGVLFFSCKVHTPAYPYGAQIIYYVSLPLADYDIK